MITLFHISDLHCGKIIAQPMDPDTHLVANPHQMALDRLFADLAPSVKSMPGVKVLVITGDLTDSGEKDQYDEVTRRIDSLRNETGCEVRIVPGNHDVGGFFGTEFSQKCANRFDKLAASLGMQPFFAESSAPPCAETFSDGEWQVRLFYLNSCSRTGIKDFSRGVLGKAQLDALAKGLKEPFAGPSILCLHHKPLTPGQPDCVMGLAEEDRQALKACIEQPGVAALLYGHQDESRRSFPSATSLYRPGTVQGCILADANSAVERQSYCRISVEAEASVRAIWCRLPEACWTR